MNSNQIADKSNRIASVKTATMKKIVYALVIFCYLAVNLTESASNNQLETCKDEKEFKNLLKTKPNLLILFGKNGKKIDR